MPAYLVVVRPRTPEAFSGHSLHAAAAALGLPLVGVAEERRYVIAGGLDFDQLTRVVEELLVDPVLSTFAIIDLDKPLSDEPVLPSVTDWAVDVAYRPGVTDNEGESIRIAGLRAGISGLQIARMVHRTILEGSLVREDVEKIAADLLYNDLVEAAIVIRPDDPEANGFYRGLITLPPESEPTIQTIPLRTADDDKLATISRDGILALDLDEMQSIQRYFLQLGREPTDGELETIAQTWSEHCSHKTFKAQIVYEGPQIVEDLPGSAEPYIQLATLNQGEATIDGLFRSYLVAATERVWPSWLLSAFVDNAGVIAFGEEDTLSFKVETHNHPSALEPFGGANTGVGGVVRDVLGVSSQPIANLDVLCFGPSDEPAETLPSSVLHPARIAAGVVAGVRDYGNKLGVPTVAGAVLYDSGYTCNPLVFCGTVGLARREAEGPRGAEPGDVVVVVGGRTGRDGIHGATFSSVELTHQTADLVGAAVQIGDPITEKQVIDVLLQAKEQGLYRAITDCGAGGLSSAVGEMGERTGVAVELADVPLKYAGLKPWEIWLSEAQERMVVAVPPASLDAFLQICRGEDVEATPIGHFTSDRRLHVTYRGTMLVDLDMAMLHDGRPQRLMTATWTLPSIEEEPPSPIEPRAALLGLLRHPNIASKEHIVRTYDHLVQGRTVQGPLGGILGDAPSDAAVLHPRHSGSELIAIGCGINPRYGFIDPYWMALLACDEALRNVVAAGGDPDHCALLDNFCWGDPREPDRLAGLVRATAACYDAAVAWETPFISGKDSLNNEYRDASGRRVPIPGTLLISALAIVPSLECVTTTDVKAAGNRLYLVGQTRDELGGSHRLVLEGKFGRDVPRVDLLRARATFRRLHSAIKKGLVRACHDLSEGGLGVASAEMAFGSAYGIELDLRQMAQISDSSTDDILLWSESPSRFLVEVAPADASAFEQEFNDLPVAQIGTVTTDAGLRIIGEKGNLVIDEASATLKKVWQHTDDA